MSKIKQGNNVVMHRSSYDVDHRQHTAHIFLYFKNISYPAYDVPLGIPHLVWEGSSVISRPVGLFCSLSGMPVAWATDICVASSQHAHMERIYFYTSQSLLGRLNEIKKILSLSGTDHRSPIGVN